MGGLVSLKKAFALTVGANLGGAINCIVAALALRDLQVGMQLASVHLLFNILGMVFWFLVPVARRVPLSMAMRLGERAEGLKLFPVVYVVLVFALGPAVILEICRMDRGPVIVWLAFIGIVSLTVVVILSLRCRANTSDVPGASAGGVGRMDPVLFGGSGSKRGIDDVDVLFEMRAWSKEPVAWSSIGFAILALLAALPSSQWAHLHYAAFDGRNHIGVGLWQVCSAMYTADMPWAVELPPCNRSAFRDCGKIAAQCNSTNSDNDRAYEAAWRSCRAFCSPQGWEQECEAACDEASSGHSQKCQNVAAA